MCRTLVELGSTGVYMGKSVECGIVEITGVALEKMDVVVKIS